MPKTSKLLGTLSSGLLLCAFSSFAGAVGGDGLNADRDPTPWSRWHGRVSFAAAAPVWRSGLGGFESGGLNVSRRPGAIDGLSLMGDYYFARSFASAGGLRATSGLVVGPRSQLLSVAQPNLSAGGLFSVDSRVFGQEPLGRFRDATGNETTSALPYIGLGYTGRAARGALSVSADLGMFGQTFGDSRGRAFGAGSRSFDDSGRDGGRILPLLQLGVLYSF